MTDASTTSLPLTAGTWNVDPAHSGVGFVIRHLGLTNVRGRFDRFDGTLVVGQSLADTRLTANVDLTSVNTNEPDRDAHLRSTDFFNADANPTMTFASTSVRRDGDDYELVGDLSINGIVQPITLTVEFFGKETHPADGSLRAGFSATGELRRGDYSINFNMPLGMGKLALGEKVKIELDAQLVLATSPPA